VLDVPIRIGDAVVVFAAGVVGSLCAQLAQATAGIVIVVDAAAARRAIARDWGADAAVEPHEATAAIRALTAGRGADVAIEATGTPAALEAAMEATGEEGTVVAVTLAGRREVPLRLAPEFHYRRQRLVSTQVDSLGAGLQPRWSLARRMEVVLDLLRAERVRVRATHTFPFDRAPEAYDVANRLADEAMGIMLTY
jgi:threonine dehydrogenase-like Zn-dependent dehydrogenase